MKEKLKSCLVLFKVFFKIGLFTFGGGYAMLPIIQKEIIENHNWISEEDMLDIVAIAESTPGPISVNTATFVGYKVAGVLGSIFATIGLAIPSLVIIFVISLVLDQFMDNIYVQYAFNGIKVAVAFLIVRAGYNLFKKMEKKIIPIISFVIVCFNFLFMILYMSMFVTFT